MLTQVPYRPTSLLTVAAAAEYFKVNERTVRRKIAEGAIPAVRLTSSP
jgi:excisionase family DNA binding protein